MVKKPTYTQTLTSLETHIVYIREHLETIDERLSKLNNSVAEHESRIGHNTTRINLSFKIVGGVIMLIVVIAPLILWGLGVL